MDDISTTSRQHIPEMGTAILCWWCHLWREAAESTSHSHSVNWESPLDLTPVCMCLDCGRKPQYITGRTCKLHTDRIRPSWDSNQEPCSVDHYFVPFTPSSVSLTLFFFALLILLSISSLYYDCKSVLMHNQVKIWLNLTADLLPVYSLSMKWTNKENDK